MPASARALALAMIMSDRPIVNSNASNMCRRLRNCMHAHAFTCACTWRAVYASWIARDRVDARACAQAHARAEISIAINIAHAHARAHRVRARRRESRREMEGTGGAWKGAAVGGHASV